MFPNRPQHGFVMEHNFMMKPGELKEMIMDFVSELQEEKTRAKKPRLGLSNASE
jgi:hypothetical protein